MATFRGKLEDALLGPNGIFSTPLCNANINKQLWFINHITCASDLEREYQKIEV